MNTKIRWAGPLLLIALVLVFCGCASTKRSGGSSLSDAAEQSKKKPEDQDKTLVAGKQAEEQKEEEAEEEDLLTAIVVSLLTATPEPEPQAQPVIQLDSVSGPPYFLPASSSMQGNPDVPDATKSGFGFSFGGLSATIKKHDGSEFIRSLTFRVFLGGWEKNPRLRASFALLISDMELSKRASTSFKNTIELGIGFYGRYYLTSRHTFMGVYGMAGLELGIMNFDFHNSIEVVDDSGRHSVSGDLIGTFTPEVGVGVGIAQTRYFHLGGMVVAGMKFFGTSTINEGFDNDFFGPSGYLGLAITMSFSKG